MVKLEDPPDVSLGEINDALNLLISLGKIELRFYPNGVIFALCPILVSLEKS